VRTRARQLVACVALLSTVLLSACGGSQANAPDGSGGPKGAGSENPAPATPSGEGGERVVVSGGSFTRVSPTELRVMMRETDFMLVNTHVPYEGNIPGTDVSIPYNEIGRNLEHLPGKGARIVLYCRSGSMSAEAAETLIELGYEDVWDLRGGMIAWEDAGFRLEGA
jgi:rhodanese-related sulfurtransferase